MLTSALSWCLMIPQEISTAEAVARMESLLVHFEDTPPSFNHLQVLHAVLVTRSSDQQVLADYLAKVRPFGLQAPLIFSRYPLCMARPCPFQYYAWRPPQTLIQYKLYSE